MFMIRKRMTVRIMLFKINAAAAMSIKTRAVIELWNRRVLIEKQLTGSLAV